MAKKLIRSQYDEPNYDGAIQIDSSKPEENLTKQAFKEEADVNVIVGRYLKNGMPFPVGQEQFLDVSDVQDYQSALNLVRSAQETFNALPAEVRLEVGNDPTRFVERTLTDPEWAEKHGLATRKTQPPSQPSSAAPAASPGGQPGPKTPEGEGSKQ